MTDRNEDRVRERAYAIWEKEGRPEGEDLRHWSDAEAELRGDETPRPANSSKKPKPRPGQLASPSRRRRWQTPIDRSGCSYRVMEAIAEIKASCR
ncbi:hypothetical protein FHT82_002836 [Rhizobium sp. BK275]|uniref:DUF2934 domain-containing protein n=1 Tax=Rhizobium sp. BK275 TaxID=2587077 RepID=UPI00161E2ED3|nr:DUF2934 domain-containing protein [Rhizobium sp. BK275]MBB3390073.1 hypothetical protein [Rhizobium sp. BK275]